MESCTTKTVFFFFFSCLVNLNHVDTFKTHPLICILQMRLNKNTVIHSHKYFAILYESFVNAKVNFLPRNFKRLTCSSVHSNPAKKVCGIRKSGWESNVAVLRLLRCIDSFFNQILIYIFSRKLTALQPV